MPHAPDFIDLTNRMAQLLRTQLTAIPAQTKEHPQLFQIDVHAAVQLPSLTAIDGLNKLFQQRQSKLVNLLHKSKPQILWERRSLVQNPSKQVIVLRVNRRSAFHVLYIRRPPLRGG